MKFYITGESLRKLKRVFTNLNTFYIIDVDSLVHDYGLNMNKETHLFIINSEIERLIRLGCKSKKYTGIIYINSNLNCDIIINLKYLLSDIKNSVIETITMLDDYDLPKFKIYYPLFDEVIFFPTFKKIKIVECKPLHLKN